MADPVDTPPGKYPDTGGKESQMSTRQDKGADKAPGRIRRPRVSQYAGGRLNVAFTVAQWEAIERAAAVLSTTMVEVVRKSLDAGLPKLLDAERKRKARKGRAKP